ncbi:MAG: hypothetical protein HY235_01570 [Acidobacteria bacterium]|nr:hypothetical protein [Acidobacteriota bacterium]
MLKCSAIVLLITAASAEVSIPPITPQITGIFPHGLRRGAQVEVLIRGRNLQNASKLHFASPKITGAILEAGPYRVRARIRAAADAELGRHDLRLLAPHGSMLNWLDISDRAESFEKEPNDSFENAQPMSFPALVNRVER